MPLRDHSRSPVRDRLLWDSIPRAWPMMIVRQLYRLVPPDFVSLPTVHTGIGDDSPPASMVWNLADPTSDTIIEIDHFEEYAVRVYDNQGERQLVASIEIVGHTNKDRIEHRQAFVSKCAELLRQGVSVSIIDLVTMPEHNLWVELLDQLGHSDSSVPSKIAATVCYWPRRKRGFLQTWSRPLAVGESLPAIPVWLRDDLVINLELESDYEEMCRLFHIP